MEKGIKIKGAKKPFSCMRCPYMKDASKYTNFVCTALNKIFPRYDVFEIFFIDWCCRKECPIEEYEE